MEEEKLLTMDSLDEECPICLSLIDEFIKYNTECCKKNLHTICYLECMKIKPECPFCRTLQKNIVIVINPQEYENNTTMNNNTLNTTLNNTLNANTMNNVHTSLCSGALRYWGLLMCGMFMCYSWIIAVNYHYHKN
jgi:hypothetical protein